MNLAQIKIAALKKRLEKISQLDASLEFTEKEIEQRRRQFSQNYLILPPVSPYTTIQRPQAQFGPKEKVERQRSGNIYSLNTDFYRKTVFPDTNVEVINNPPVQKPLITLKPVEQVSSSQSPAQELNLPPQNNNFQKTKSAPQLVSTQQTKPQASLMFNQNNMKDSKPNIQINAGILDKDNSKKQATVGLFGTGFQAKTGQNIFQLKKGPLFNKKQSLIGSAPLLLGSNIPAQNKAQPFFRNSTQELPKITTEQKKDENKVHNTPDIEIEDKKVPEVINQQPNQISLKKDVQQNQAPKLFENPKPKIQVQPVKQKKESPKYPEIYSPMLGLQTPPQLIEQINKNLEKGSREIQIFGPKGRTIQGVPFFGNITKPVVSSGQFNKTDNASKPPVPTPAFLGANSQTNEPASSLFTNIQTNKPPANLFTTSQANQPTPNLFSKPDLQTNTSPFNLPTSVPSSNPNPPSLFGNPLAKVSGAEFAQSFLKNAATGGIFAGQSNSLFNQGGGNIFSNPSSNSLFSGQPSNSLFSGAQTTGGLFAAKNPAPQEDEEQSGEGDEQPLEAEENFNPQLSTGKYDYIQTNIMFKEAINKFRKGKGQMLENITVSLQQFQDKPDVFLFIRLANKVIGFTGKIVLKTTQIRILNNSTRNIQISKILECGENVSKPELCLLRLQLKDEQSGSKFKQQFQKVLKGSS